MISGGNQLFNLDIARLAGLPC